MDISSDYINEYYKINPTINDFFLKEEWNKKRHIQPIIYSEDYYKKLNDLDKKYLKLLNKKDCLSFEDKLLFNNLAYDIHLEEDYEIYMYMPVNSMNNLLFDYISEANGNGSFIFELQNASSHQGIRSPIYCHAQLLTKSMSLHCNFVSIGS